MLESIPLVLQAVIIAVITLVCEILLILIGNLILKGKEKDKINGSRAKLILFMFMFVLMFTLIKLIDSPIKSDNVNSRETNISNSSNTELTETNYPEQTIPKPTMPNPTMPKPTMPEQTTPKPTMPNPTKSVVKTNTVEDYSSSSISATSIVSAVYPPKKNEFIKIHRGNRENTYYKVDLKENEGLTVALRPQIDNGIIYIYLCDSNGSALKTACASDARYAVIDYIAKKDAAVYIKVTGATGIYYIGFYDQYFNNSNSQNDERDFFGSLGTAKEIKSGIIDKNDNIENWYRIALKEGQKFTIEITPRIDKGIMYIYLYGDEKSQLQSSCASDAKTAMVSKIASQDSTYYVKVTGAKGSYNLNYTIN